MSGQNPMASCWSRGGRRQQARAAQKRVEASSRLVRSSPGFQWSAREAEGLSELSFLRISALRDRKTDIEILVAYFMECMQRETGMAHTLSDEALDLMIQYDWPGNKRELENAIRRASPSLLVPFCKWQTCHRKCRAFEPAVRMPDSPQIRQRRPGPMISRQWRSLH